MSKEQVDSNSHITHSIIVGLYKEDKQATQISPILQILGFEESALGHQTEITIRLSDGTVFIDCSLIGPYVIEKHSIIYQDHGQTTVFKKFDIVKLSDCFCKIDFRRICQLRIIIRKMDLVQKCSARLNRPQEVSQYFRYMNEGRDFKGREEEMKEHRMFQERKDAMVEKRSDVEHEERVMHSAHYEVIKKQSKKKVKDVIKIEDDTQNHLERHVALTVDKKQPQKNQQKPIPEENDPVLTASEVMQGKPGYFIGRLLRLKLGARQTKDGPITVLALGFIDKKKQLLRVNLAGRLALKQSKQLKKGRCYYVKGFQFYKTDKMQHSQLKIKEKQCNIYQVPEETKSQKYPYSYFHWDHENSQIETESVDIIGIIDEIEEKTAYPQNGNEHRQNRQVIRIIVRNTIKTVKISFWAEQIQSLKALKLKRNEEVIFEDIKKKKNMFLDFTVESNLIRLEENEALKRQFRYLIPEHFQQDEPKNLRDLQKLYEKYPDNAKTRTFDLFLTNIEQNKVIYKICANCKKKVEKQFNACIQCGTQEFYYKFNCQVQFSDFTGSVSCVLFDQIAAKIFGKTAAEINQLNEEEFRTMMDGCLYQQYQIGIENKNLRLIARSFLDQSYKQISAKNIESINEIKQ